MKVVDGSRLCCGPQQLHDGALPRALLNGGPSNAPPADQEFLLLKWRPRRPDTAQICNTGAWRRSLLRGHFLVHLPDRSAISILMRGR
ncbi:hypothetical protein ACVWW4_003840 [Bradyrhizobium sp. LB7.1]